MTKFEEYLIGLGYKRYRCVYRKKKFSYEEDNGSYSFSTMLSGGLDFRYILNDDFKSQIIFGLNERNKPPTICSPRPKNIISDDQMNRFIKDNSPEDILKAILQK